GVRGEIETMIDDTFEEFVLTTCDDRLKPMNWDLHALAERFRFICNAPFAFPDGTPLEQQNLFDALRLKAREVYEAHAREMSGKMSELGELLSKEVAMWEERLAGVVPVIDGRHLDFGATEQQVFLETLDL